MIAPSMDEGGGERGCGSRKKGGIYLECGSAGGGIPMSTIIADPIAPIDMAALGISPVGQHPLQQDGCWHLADVIGSEHYPNAADFLSEALWMGVSRRISRRFDFSKITASSMLLLIHQRAIAMRNDGQPRHGWHCPMIPMRHQPDMPLCCGSHWMNVLPDDRTMRGSADHHLAVMMAASIDGLLAGDGCAPAGMISFGVPRPHLIRMPSLAYVASLMADESVCTWQAGIIARCPIERIVVVDDPHDAEHVREMMDRISASSVPRAVVAQ